MVGAGGDAVVEIGSEDQFLIASFAADIEFDRDERHLLHLDTAAFGPESPAIETVFLSPQHRGE